MKNPSESVELVGLPETVDGATNTIIEILQRPTSKPKFVWAHITFPHLPIWLAQPHLGYYSKTNDHLDIRPSDVPASNGIRGAELFRYLEKLRDRYDEGLRYLDEGLDLFFEALEGNGLKGTTYVFVTSDHGEAYIPEKKLAYYHDGDVWEEELVIPLVVWPRSKQSPNRVQREGLTMDITATILDLVDLEENRIEGRSLVDPNPRENNGIVVMNLKAPVDAGQCDATFGFYDGPWKVRFDPNMKTITLFDLRKDTFAPLDPQQEEFQSKALSILQRYLPNLPLSCRQNVESVLFTSDLAP